MSTPPPTSPHLLDGAEDAGTSSNPWRVDDDDLAEADPPASSKFHLYIGVWVFMAV
jgi:hypothetical protein